MAVVKSLLARIAKRGGNRLIDRTLTRMAPQQPAAKTTLGGKLAGAALMRIAMRSVPGAILIGGGMLARAIHRQRMAERARLAAAAKPVKTTPKAAK